MYKIVGGKVSSNACCLSRSPRIVGISETSKGQIDLKLKGLLLMQHTVELCDSLHTSLVWGTQKVYTSSKCNWKNLRRGKKIPGHDYTNLLRL